MMKLLQENIDRLTRMVQSGAEQWSDFEDSRESLDYDGAGNYFGHADDCFDAGTEYGQYLEMEETLALLNKLKENNE